MGSFMHYTGERLATLLVAQFPAIITFFCSFENAMRAYNKINDDVGIN